MTVTLTLHAWWLAAYLGLGLALWLPGEYVAWRSIHRPRGTFWSNLRSALFGKRWRREWPKALASVVLWPVAWWELLR